jgi:hypothetical protein
VLLRAMVTTYILIKWALKGLGQINKVNDWFLSLLNISCLYIEMFQCVFAC